MNNEKVKDQFVGEPLITNLDDAPLGFSRAAPGATNNPDSFWVTVMTTGYSNDFSYKQQFVFPWSGMEGHRVKWRKCDSGNWGTWEEFSINTGTLEGTTAELKNTSMVNFTFFDTDKGFFGYRVNIPRGFADFYTKLDGNTGSSQVFVRKQIDGVYYGDW